MSMPRTLPSRSSPGIWLAAGLLLGGSAAAPAPGEEPPDPLPPPLVAPEILPPGEEPRLAPLSGPTITFEERVLEIVNEDRLANGGLPPLKGASELEDSSGTHSFHMAHRDFFAHCDLDTKDGPGQRILDAGYSYTFAGENIAAGYTSPEDVMAGWMASEGHKDNILSTSYREVGVGYFLQENDQNTVRRDFSSPPDCDGDDSGESGHGPYLHYWTQNFGRRSGVYPVVIEREAHATTDTTVDLYLYGQGWAQEMRFSDDGCTWSAWEPFQAETAWALPGGGHRTLRAQIRDGATVVEAEDAIVVDVACGAPEDVDLTGSTVDSCQVYEACDTVSATDGFEVTATGDLTFRAGRRIVLGDGFSVASGGSFRAVVDSTL